LGKEGTPHSILPNFSQEMLAEMIARSGLV
jgi:hypothetical protein